MSETIIFSVPDTKSYPNKDMTLQLHETNDASVSEMAAGVINKGTTTILAARKATPTSELTLGS